MSQTDPPALDGAACRRQFPALSRTQDGQPVVYFDAAAGTQVPHGVIDSVCRYLCETNANHGGVFATSRESDEMLVTVRRQLADFFGTDDPDTVVFGPNMTTLTFALSRALMKTWKPGDEIVVTDLEHDANVTPWVLAAREVGVNVKSVRIDPADCTLDLEDFQAKLSPKTRLVAVTCASNAVGTLTPVVDLVRWAHGVGALIFLDAVHYAPHRPIEVKAWDCDFLVCSAYKFFGPHVGVLWGKPEWLVSLPCYKLRPVPERIPDRWMTGTQNHEGIAGVGAAIEYLTQLGRDGLPQPKTRRECLTTAYQAIMRHEQGLTRQLLEGLAELPDITVWGIRDPGRMGERVPTVSITHRRLPPKELAEYLALRGIYTWHGNFYALPLTMASNREPEGLLRISMVHYNTQDEVRRLLACLRELKA